MIPADMLIISPHLDDAVLACGKLLAANPGAVVATVFAGMPDDSRQQTDWDRRSGFADAGTAVASRREEDRTALSMLGARAVWLDFLDDQYLPPEQTEALVDAVLALSRAHPTGPLLFPMGMWHEDHVRLHHACLRALGDQLERELLAYEDAVYRTMPGLLQQRLAALNAAGIEATPVDLGTNDDADDLKWQAVLAYASQCRAAAPHGFDDARSPERYWRLTYRCGPVRPIVL